MTSPSQELKHNLKWPWRIGQLAQGLILGVLLFIAILGLLALSGSVTLFRYQGY